MTGLENGNTQRIIAGPCALESRLQAELTVIRAKEQGIKTVRMNLWKPRTRPGFEGVGEEGIPWVVAAAERGVTPAMEVIMPEHVDLLMEAVLGRLPHATLLLWIGSRNQNHIVQRDIGKAVAGEPRVELMIKNPMWRDDLPWQGAVEHVLDGGVSIDQLLLCHRGFAPRDKARAKTRNILDLKMALALKNELNIPLIMDPSHIGGKVEAVKTLIRKFSKNSRIDGQIIEVHPHPLAAKTDAQQQLTWGELDEVLSAKGAE